MYALVQHTSITARWISECRRRDTGRALWRARGGGHEVRRHILFRSNTIVFGLCLNRWYSRASIALRYEEAELVNPARLGTIRLGLGALRRFLFVKFLVNAPKKVLPFWGRRKSQTFASKTFPEVYTKTKLSSYFRRKPELFSDYSSGALRQSVVTGSHASPSRLGNMNLSAAEWFPSSCSYLAGERVMFVATVISALGNVLRRRFRI